jgi:hypothetical protein
MQEGTSPIGSLENSEKDVETMLATLIRVFARKNCLAPEDFTPFPKFLPN